MNYIHELEKVDFNKSGNRKCSYLGILYKFKKKLPINGWHKTQCNLHNIIKVEEKLPRSSVSRDDDAIDDATTSWRNVVEM